MVMQTIVLPITLSIGPLPFILQMVPRGSSPNWKSLLDVVDTPCVQSEQSICVTTRSEPTLVQFFCFHLRAPTPEMLEISSLVFTVGRRSEISLRPGGSVGPSDRLDVLPVSRLEICFCHPSWHLPLPKSSISIPVPSSAAPASTLQLPSRFVLFSSPPPQRWLQLSSTGSNRHQITINPASLDLPIVILLGG